MKVLVSGRTKFLIVANFYGIFGSSSYDKKCRANKELIFDVIRRAIEAGDSSYLVCGDFNVGLRDSQVVVAAIKFGLLVDVGHEWATTWTEDESGEVTKHWGNTYHRDGPTEGSKGMGATRIDTILANPTAANAIASFKPRWDLVEEAHVPLQIEIDIDTLNDTEVVQKTVGLVNCTIDPEDIDCDIGKVYDKVERVYGETLMTQLDQGGVSVAHVTWNKMVEIATMI